MTSLLSGISGHFTRGIVLGVLLPVVIFVLLTQAFTEVFSPQSWGLLAALPGDEETRALAASLAVTMMLTGLLHVLNIPVIRFFEGYPWKKSLLGRWREGEYRRQLKQLTAAERRPSGSAARKRSPGPRGASGPHAAILRSDSRAATPSRCS